MEHYTKKQIAQLYEMIEDAAIYPAREAEECWHGTATWKGWKSSHYWYSKRKRLRSSISIQASKGYGAYGLVFSSLWKVTHSTRRTSEPFVP